MKRVWCADVQPSGVAGSMSSGGSEPGTVSHGKMPSAPCVRTGKPAAATAAGLLDVWSTIKLLTTRGCVSKTRPFFCAYEVAGPGGPNMGGFDSAVLKLGVASRG